MTQLRAYHRPSNVDEVLKLLSRPQVNLTLVAGGTYINAHMDETATEVVDLQAAHLDNLHYADNRLTLGAMVRLQTIVEAVQAPALLRQMAHRAGANTFRHAATIGGMVVQANPESELLAALLVFDAEVQIQSPAGAQRLKLPDFLANVPAALNGGLVTAVSLATSGQGASDRVARTPADQPIVAAVGRLDEKEQIHLALCGVAPTPILVKPDLAQLQASLTPPADFRGSSEYRRQVAITLSGRVIDSLQKEMKGS